MQMFPDDTGFVTSLPDGGSGAAGTGDTLAFDYAAARFVLTDGSPDRQNGAAAVRQWVHRMLTTYRGRFAVYAGTRFGHTGEDLIGMRQAPDGFIHSELAREIREACALCPAIERADDFTFARAGRQLHVRFTVTLRTGEEMEVSADVG